MTGLVGAGRALAASTTDVLASSDNFKPLIGSTFSVNRVSMKLLSVTDFRLPTKTTASNASQPTGAGYALVFDSSRYPNLTGSVRNFSHPSLGTWKMFLGPVDRGSRAESVINRFR